MAGPTEQWRIAGLGLLGAASLAVYVVLFWHLGGLNLAVRSQIAIDVPPARLVANFLLPPEGAAAARLARSHAASAALFVAAITALVLLNVGAVILIGSSWSRA